MNQKRDKPKPDRLLIVEGHDDYLAVTGLARKVHPGIPEPQIRAPDGWTEAISACALAAKDSRAHPRLGLVLDADADFLSRWQAVRDQLAPSGVTLPEKPTFTKGELIYRADGSRIGIWLMPTHQDSGELEELLIGLGPNLDATWPIAERAVRAAKSLGALIVPGDERKVTLRTWLPWCDEPGTTFQTAALQGRFGDLSGAARFLDWYAQVFT